MALVAWIWSAIISLQLNNISWEMCRLIQCGVRTRIVARCQDRLKDCKNHLNFLSVQVPLVPQGWTCTQFLPFQCSPFGLLFLQQQAATSTIYRGPDGRVLKALLSTHLPTTAGSTGVSAEPSQCSSCTSNPGALLCQVGSTHPQNWAGRAGETCWDSTADPSTAQRKANSKFVQLEFGLN